MSSSPHTSNTERAMLAGEVEAEAMMELGMTEVDTNLELAKPFIVWLWLRIVC
jgi:hypothetical protein